MKIFIGWSECSEIAARLERFLLQVNKNRVSVSYSGDLPHGGTWFSDLTKMLHDADVAFLCVVPASKPSWLLYEAGVLSETTLSRYTASGEPCKQKTPHVIPLLFGIDSKKFADTFDPLTRIEKCVFEREAMKRLLSSVNLMHYHMSVKSKSLNSRTKLPTFLPDKELVRNFEKFFPSFERDIRRLMAANDLDQNLGSYLSKWHDLGSPTELMMNTLQIHAKALLELLRLDIMSLNKDDVEVYTSERRNSLQVFRSDIMHHVERIGYVTELKHLEQSVNELERLLTNTDGKVDTLY